MPASVLQHNSMRDQLRPCSLPLAATQDAKALLDAEREGKDIHVLRVAGLVLISASRDKTIRIWDVIGGTCMQTLVRSWHQQFNETTSAKCVYFTLFCSCHSSSLRLRGSMRLLRQIGHDNWVRQVLVHPTGEHIISCSDDRSIRTWNVLTGEHSAGLRFVLQGILCVLAFPSRTLVIREAKMLFQWRRVACVCWVFCRGLRAHGRASALAIRNMSGVRRKGRYLG